MVMTMIMTILLVVAVLIGGLILYGVSSRSEAPLMGGGCHGDCAHCASRCEPEKKKDDPEE